MRAHSRSARSWNSSSSRRAARSASGLAREASRVSPGSDDAIVEGQRRPRVGRGGHQPVTLVPGGGEVPLVLAEQARGGARRLALRLRQQAHAGEVGRIGNLQEVEQRRDEVERAGQRAAADAGRRAGHGHDQRDRHAGLEQVLAVVEVVVVLAEALAVVRGQHDDGLPGEARRGERIEHRADFLVRRPRSRRRTARRSSRGGPGPATAHCFGMPPWKPGTTGRRRDDDACASRKAVS